MQKSRANREGFQIILALHKERKRKVLYSQRFAGDVFIRSPGLTTEDMMVDNNSDTESPEGRGDRVHQKEKESDKRLQRRHVCVSLSDLTNYKGRRGSEEEIK